MGRPISEGFAYFYHDVDMSSDEKVELLEERHILTGYAIYNKLLERIYRNGGFLVIVLPETTKLLARKFKVSEDELKEIISSCVEFDLFNKELYEQKVITSKGILTRSKSVHDNRLNSRKKQGDYSVTETEKQFYNYYQTITKEKPKNEISEVKRSEVKKKRSKEVETPDFEMFEEWTNLILEKKDAAFETMLMKEKIDYNEAAIKDHRNLLARYPKMQPAKQQEFRYSLLKHIQEFKPKANGTTSSTYETFTPPPKR